MEDPIEINYNGSNPLLERIDENSVEEDKSEEEQIVPQNALIDQELRRVEKCDISKSNMDALSESLVEYLDEFHKVDHDNLENSVSLSSDSEVEEQEQSFQYVSTRQDEGNHDTVKSLLEESKAPNTTLKLNEDSQNYKIMKSVLP